MIFYISISDQGVNQSPLQSLFGSDDAVVEDAGDIMYVVLKQIYC